MKKYYITWCLALCTIGLVSCADVASVESKGQSSTDNIRSFVEQLTNLLNQGAFGQAYQGLQYPEDFVSGAPGRPGYRPKPGGPYYPRPGSPGRPVPFPGPGGNRPPPGRPFPPGGPFPRPGEPLPPPGGPFPGPGEPFPPPGGPFPRPGEPLPPPGRPFPPGGPYPPPGVLYPGGYPGQGGLYPPTSIMGALSSIARYDDLRCVPRLLCEVASGARPGNDYSQQSVVPFISKDALVTLLTVLNFVDDSPLLVFGRAALLGYTAQGDPRACNIAYPTCPREPDRLVDYLNNHNGGFFRFFNQQIPQYAPHYQQYQPNRYPSPYPQGNPTAYPFRKYQPQSESYPQQYSAQNQKYYQSRIQTQPESNVEFNQYTSQSGVRQEQLTLLNQDQHDYYSTDQGQDYYSGLDQDYYQSDQSQDNRLTFSDAEYQGQYDQTLQSQNQAIPNLQSQNQQINHNYYSTQSQGNPLVFPKSESATGNRGGKGLSFPTEDSTKFQQRPQKAITMVFPDRTGTGDLRLDVDQYGGYKTVYFQSNQKRPEQSSIFRDQRFTKEVVTFPKDGAVNDRHKYAKGRPTMHFPES